MANLNSGTSIGGNTAMETGAFDNVSVGYFTTSDASVTGVGFQPKYIEIFATLHQAAFNTEYSSGANTGAGANGCGFSMGVATSGAASDQLVTGYSWNSNSSNGHHSYVGDGEVVYLIHTSSNGTTIDGRTRATISSFDADGFSLSWTAAYTSTQMVYRAYK